MTFSRLLVSISADKEFIQETLFLIYQRKAKVTTQMSAVQAGLAVAKSDMERDFLRTTLAKCERRLAQLRHLEKINLKHLENEALRSADTFQPHHAVPLTLPSPMSVCP